MLQTRYCSEGSLADWIARAAAAGAPAPSLGRDVALLLWQVAKAVQHMHDRRLVHNDVKPTNVLVRAQLGRLAAALTDFDASTAAQPPHNAKNSAAAAGATTLCAGMTRRYAAPEVLDDPDAPRQPAQDVYSLGATAAEAMRAAGAVLLATPFGTGAQLRCHPPDAAPGGAEPPGQRAQQQQQEEGAAGGAVAAARQLCAA
eukprot:gene2623-8078_t